MPYSLSVNGDVHHVAADGQTPLLWVLRDMLKLTGTKYGCGAGLCGACTVHVDDQPVRSCTISLEEAASARVVTIAVLDELRRRAAWGCPLERGWAQGMAVHESFGTVVGQVAEVRLDDGRASVRRVVGVVDCGIAISPDQVAAQLEGAIGFGLSAALHGAMTLKDGVVQETNFDRYRVLRMNEMPTVETYILPSTAKPSGMGEPGVPPIAPAVANAILKLTGSATRSLPFAHDGKSQSAGLSSTIFG